MTENIYCKICGHGDKYLIWNCQKKYYTCRNCWKLVGWMNHYKTTST